MALGSPRLADDGGILRNNRGFVKSCFSVPFGEVFAFESELMAVMHALDYAKVRF